jgi:SAM-dependent methyltransferase
VPDPSIKQLIDSILQNFYESNFSRNSYYHAKEYLLYKLLDELRIVQGASVRTLTITDQYVQIAREHFSSLSGRHILEIGPGSNLGAGIIFRYLGAASYTGVELFTDQDFNNWSTLNSIEALARIKYGNFLDNFNGVAVGIASTGELNDIISLEEQGIKLLQPKGFSQINLPDASVDMVYSNFTFEHLQNPRAIATEIARLLKPGAITAHFIDIEDHSDFANPFNYLIFSDEEWEARYGDGKTPEWGYENRYRASDFRQFFATSGLTLLKCERLRSAKISDELLKRIAPRFKHYDRDDLQTVWLMIVATKPATQHELDRPHSGEANLGVLPARAEEPAGRGEPKRGGALATPLGPLGNYSWSRFRRTFVKPTSRFSHNGGYAWACTLDVDWSSDDLADGQRSQVMLLEDGAPLGPAHTLHDVIRSQGRGAFSHWSGQLYFSTSDNTNPNQNGKQYLLSYKDQTIKLNETAT